VDSLADGASNVGIKSFAEILKLVRPPDLVSGEARKDTRQSNIVRA
jgi:hypothetical protein